MPGCWPAIGLRLALTMGGLWEVEAAASLTSLCKWPYTFILYSPSPISLPVFRLSSSVPMVAESSPSRQVVVALPKVTAAIIPASSGGGAPQVVDAGSGSGTGDFDESAAGAYEAATEQED
uniref:Secreted protein n=1 Tax=Oryza punctata TaxID=4537 RepID=A0A0E0K1S6_ORYPU